jgi:hypothetical protein
LLNGTQVVTQTFNTANQIAGYSYDAAGNLTNDGTASYAYDVLGRMTGRDSTTYTSNGDRQPLASGCLFDELKREDGRPPTVGRLPFTPPKGSAQSAASEDCLSYASGHGSARRSFCSAFSTP